MIAGYWGFVVEARHFVKRPHWLPMSSFYRLANLSSFDLKASLWFKKYGVAARPNNYTKAG